MSAIQLRFKRSFYVRHGIVGGMLVFFCAVIALSARHLGPLVRLGVPVLFMGPWLLLVLREYFLAAREMDEKGVTRHDGRRFFWNDLEKVQEVHLRIHGRTGALNHVDLHFAAGKVRILYMVLENGWKGIEFAKGQEAGRMKALRKRLCELLSWRLRTLGRSGAPLEVAGLNTLRRRLCELISSRVRMPARSGSALEAAWSREDTQGDQPAWPEQKKRW